MVSDELKQQIIRAYKQPGHPAAFSAPGNVARLFNISKKAATDILEHIDSRTLHREYHKPRHYNPYYVFKRREQVQSDLIDMQEISRANDGVRYLMILIDVFTKRIWVYPLKTKTGVETSQVIERWINSLTTPPDILRTDRGTEYTNVLVQNVLAEGGIEWQPAGGPHKAAVAERLNRSLQNLIYTYLSDRESLRYIDNLQDIVKTYMRRPHRSLKWMSPKEADRPTNELRVRGIFMARYAKHELNRQHKDAFKLEDIVRLKTSSSSISSSRRSYAEQFTGEYFKIARINRAMPIIMYYVKSMNTGEHIEEGFYANELQRVKGGIYKIEKIVRRRTRYSDRLRRNVPEVLVKWLHFDKEEWIPESDIRDFQ
jgi:hypothetical protein